MADTPRVTVPVELAEYERLICATEDLIREVSDPGTEALAAVYCARRILHQSAMLAAAPAPEGGAVKKALVEAYCSGWEDGNCREDYSADKARSEADRILALATREEAPAEAGEDWSRDDIETLISDALTDSFDVDWDAGDGAMAVLRALEKEGLLLRAQPPAREDAQPVAWRLLAQQQPKPGHKIITLHDDGSGAALLFVHDGGVIDSDGDDYDTIGSPQTRWAYLPDDFEFWCEGLPEEPVTLPAHRVPDHPAPDALRVAVEALEKIKAGVVEVFDDELQCNVEASMDGEEASEIAAQALAALQAEQGAK